MAHYNALYCQRVTEETHSSSVNAEKPTGMEEFAASKNLRLNKLDMPQESLQAMVVHAGNYKGQLWAVVTHTYVSLRRVVNASSPSAGRTPWRSSSTRFVSCPIPVPRVVNRWPAKLRYLDASNTDYEDMPLWKAAKSYNFRWNAR